MTEWEPVIGLEMHVQLKTRTKMFCRCESGWGAAPNTRTCPVCLAQPGRAAGSEPDGDRVDDPARPRARLRDRRARALPPQELLLPGQPEGLPDLPVRRPALRRRPLRRARPGRRPRGRDRARAPRGGRGEDGARRRRRRPDRRLGALARRLQPRRHAARRDRHRSPTSTPPTRRSASCSCSARRSSSSGSPTRRWRRARCAPTRTSRCARPAPTSCARAPRSRT